MQTIKVKPWGQGQGDFVLMNAADFVEGVHELYEPAPAPAAEAEPAPAPAPKPARKTAATPAA